MDSLKVTRKQIAAMISEHQNNDFAPVIFTVVDYRETYTVTTVEPLRRDSEIAYYEDHGYTCKVRANNGDFPAYVAPRVIELTRQEAKVMTFRFWDAAAAFVRDNYAELTAARTAFWA